MQFNSTQKNRVWQKYHRNSRIAKDPFGDYIEFSDFDIDHILPVSRGGTDNIRNLIPMSKKSNWKKGDNLSGWINLKFFKVQEHQSGIGTLYINNWRVSK